MSAVGLCVDDGENHLKNGSLSRRTGHVNRPAVTFDDFAADSQAYARAFVDVPRMQSLEYVEDAFGILLFEPDSVIFDAEEAFLLGGDVGSPGALFSLLQEMSVHLDRGRFIDPVELQGIADEILEELLHLQRVGHDRRQVAQLDASFHSFDLDLQVGHDVASNRCEIDRFELLGPCGYARQGKQSFDESLHTCGGILHSTDTLPAGFIQVAAAFHFQAVAERADFA